MFNALFNYSETTPTLAQYYPWLTYFREENGELFASGFGSGIPLINYQLYDCGGVYTYDEMEVLLKEFDIDLSNELKKYHLDHTVLKLPFVFVGTRSNSIVSYHGVNIFPGLLSDAITESEFNSVLTGRFSLTKNMNDYFVDRLIVKMELREGLEVSDQLTEGVLTFLTQSLCTISSEYKCLYQTKTEDVVPILTLFEYRTGQFQKVSHKEKWVE